MRGVGSPRCTLVLSLRVFPATGEPAKRPSTKCGSASSSMRALWLLIQSAPSLPGILIRRDRQQAPFWLYELDAKGLVLAHFVPGNLGNHRPMDGFIRWLCGEALFAAPLWRRA
jgi:hypothetical protein